MHLYNTILPWAARWRLFQGGTSDWPLGANVHMLSILQVSNAAETSAAIHFVFPELCSLGSESVNGGCNAFTLEMNVHRDFGELRITLLPTVGRHPCS